MVVPTADGPFYAGTYEKVLEFEFDGMLITPVAPLGLNPGDYWPGPHVGVSYVLAAGGKDIYFKNTAGNRETKSFLSDHVGEPAAERLARRLASQKGSAGGRIYINECGEFFAPPVDDSGQFVYLGPLGEDGWFPAPDVPRD